LVQKRLQGVFGEFTLNYDDWLYLTATGRNDWTSTLPKQSRSFFYSSLSGSFVFTELLPKNKVLSFGKLRGSYAETAKDIPPYQTQSVYTAQLTSGGGFAYGFTNNNPGIVPERQKTYEFGTELRFFSNRFGIDATYYNTLNKGQIVRLVRLSYGSGFILSTLNVADTRNEGLEIVFNANWIRQKNFRWTTNFNFAKTRNKVLYLPANIPEYYNSDTWLDNFRGGLIPGGTTTTLTGTSYLTNNKGQVLIDPGSGLPVVNGTYTKIAERNPDFNLGIQNMFTYKTWNLSFLLDVKVGGDIMNGTENYLTRVGLSKHTENREEPILINGVLRNGLENTANPTPNTIQIVPHYLSDYYRFNIPASVFVEKDVNWVRLRDITLQYNVPAAKLTKNKVFQNLAFFVTGTDLFIITNYSGVDPAVNGNSTATAGVGSLGVDYLNVGTPRGVNFGVRTTFKNISPK
jgi:TonB dependent receptor